MTIKSAERIKKPILIPLAVVLLLFIGIVFWGASQLQKKHLNEILQADLQGIDLLFRKLLDQEALVLDTLIDFYEHDESLQKAFLEEDRNMLLQKATTLYKEINSKSNVTHFYFHKPDRVCFLRVHTPSRHGDIINRFTLDQAIREKTKTHGIELGPLGTFTLRVVRPWRIDNELIGYIELGKEIEHITPKLKEVLNLDLFFIINKSFLNRDNWEEGLKITNRAGNWDQFPDDIVIDKTMDSIPKKLNDLMGASHKAHQHALFDSTIKNREYLGGCVKLKDAANREVGNIIVFKDFTNEKNSLWVFLVILMASSISIGGTLFLLFYKIIDRLENNLATAQKTLKNQHEKLEKTHADLKATQSQILQQEKMASVGQLAAGVAHEINNPIGFIMSNMGTLNKYVDRLKEFIGLQTKAIGPVINNESLEELNAKRKKLKVDHILEDVPGLIMESLEGAERVKEIVQNLKNFSRMDQAETKPADINECLESTLKIVWNELKYKCEMVKKYGELPLTVCIPQQLNQVFVNLLVNAANAIEKQGVITIKTWTADSSIYVSISDTGSGIAKENLNRLFEPFFTTKGVGKGTGLGLSIAYDIVTKKHNGGLTVESEEGKGSTFTIKLPVVQGES